MVYVTDCMQLTGQGKYPVTRWYDTIERKPVDNRSGDEIALDVIKAAGLTVKGGDE